MPINRSLYPDNWEAIRLNHATADVTLREPRTRIQLKLLPTGRVSSAVNLADPPVFLQLFNKSKNLWL